MCVYVYFVANDRQWEHNGIVFSDIKVPRT